MAGSGLTMMAGIKTLDTSIIGAIIISGIVTALHNRLFDKKLPVFLGIFRGTSYVVIIAFLVMIPCAWLTLLGWPKVQMGIESLQAVPAFGGCAWGVGLHLPRTYSDPNRFTPLHLRTVYLWSGSC